MFFAKTPWFVKLIYPDLIWNKSRDEKKIYLTFDDGPVPEATPFVLNELKKANAKATFFMIGDNVRKYPELKNQVIAEGHSIGNHTFNHLKGWNTNTAMYLENTAKCGELINTNLFRPPYGRATFSQLNSIKKTHQIIMWEVLTGDYMPEMNKEMCLKNAISHSKNGSIILFHDSIKAFENMSYALPKALEYWKNEGFEICGL